ncbi:MAG: TIGR00296 family protein [Nitrososphaerota archaeon]|nr:TIGR00296 family protein [Nitrososphaerota archaeon]
MSGRGRRFVVDGMLGSTARKLRLYGFDALYFADAPDGEMLRMAGARTLLTADRALAAAAGRRRLPVLLLAGGDDAERVGEVFKFVGHAPRLDPSLSRCASCNGELAAAEGAGAPPKVLDSHDEFFRCTACGRIYWEGGHWLKLEAFDRRVRSLMGMEAYGLADGTWMVRTARDAIAEYLKEGRRLGPRGVPAFAKASRGVFVSIKSHPSGELRGCIGRPMPDSALVDSLVDSAIDSATADPRFRPVTAEELAASTVEVSALTEPVPVTAEKPLDYRKEIVVGRDGLMLQWEMGAGLLLPQVAVEEGWDVDDFLSYVCMKAGAPPDRWLSGGVKLFRFGAEVFYEVSPGGEVRRKSLDR